MLRAVLAAAWPGSLARASVPVTVLTAREVAAYSLALDGLRAGLGEKTALQVFDLDRSQGRPALPRGFAPPRSGVVVAIGSEAALAASSERLGVPLICTMALRSDLPAGSGDAQHGFWIIDLDVPLEALTARLKQLFPGKTRLGVLYKQGRPGISSARLEAEARQRGVSLRMAACNRPEDLLKSFLSLRGEVDFVWCVPDSDLFNSSTVQALLRASLTNRIPLIGFSESFVRAGAAWGVYPDFRAVGVQTAESIQRYENGRPPSPLESARVFRAGVNERVVRLLGLEPAIPRNAGQDVVILR